MSAIDLYYWPTPERLEDHHHAGGVRPSLRGESVNIGKGEQFEPEFLEIAPNNRMPAIVDPEGPGRRSRSRSSNPAPSCSISAARPASSIRPTSARACRGRRVAVLADGRPRPDGRPGPSLPQLRAGEDPLRHRPLHQRGQPALRRHEQAPRPVATSWPATTRSPTWPAIGWVGPYKNQGQDLDDFPQSQALVRDPEGTAGRGARARGRRGAPAQPRAGQGGGRRSCSGSARADGLFSGRQPAPDRCRRTISSKATSRDRALAAGEPFGDAPEQCPQRRVVPRSDVPDAMCHVLDQIEDGTRRLVHQLQEQEGAGKG